MIKKHNKVQCAYSVTQMMTHAGGQKTGMDQCQASRNHEKEMDEKIQRRKGGILQISE